MLTSYAATDKSHTSDTSSEFPAKKPRTALRAGLVGAVLGACLGVAAHAGLAQQQAAPQEQMAVAVKPAVEPAVVGPGPLEDVLGELTPPEVRAVAAFVTKQGWATHRAEGVTTWIAGPSGVELLFPPKRLVTRYLQGGPKPQRFARVTLAGSFGGQVKDGEVREYKVGPIASSAGAPSLANATATLLAGRGGLPSGRLPLSKRPEESGGDDFMAQPLVAATLTALFPVLEPIFGQIFPEVAPQLPYDKSLGQAIHFLRDDWNTTASHRDEFLKFLWQPPVKMTEAVWLHPLPFSFRIQLTALDPKDWYVDRVTLCGQTFATIKEVLAAKPTCRYDRKVNPQDAPINGDAASPAASTQHGHVKWGEWELFATQRPSTGLALHDIRFRGERIAYEVSLQDAQAAYSGELDQFFYADAAFSLSMLTASLVPGVDCPADAIYLNATNFMDYSGILAQFDTGKAFPFTPMCVFSSNSHSTVWRHMQSANRQVTGRTRRSLFVRSIVTVGNYDYISTARFDEDGSVHASTEFAGYLETRWVESPEKAGDESKFSTILRPQLAGPLHSHIVAWKADLDVGREQNSLQVTEVGIEDEPKIGIPSKVLTRRLVPTEGVGASTFSADPQKPSVWAVVDRASTTPGGNFRGVAVSISHLPVGQVLPPGHPASTSMPFTKYHLAVTQHHDEEYRVSSVYDMYDPLEPQRTVDQYLGDGESLEDVDLVCWVTVGREHIPREEDLPLVTNFGASFVLLPFNLHPVNPATGLL